jgi:hypothetical protein
MRYTEHLIAVLVVSGFLALIYFAVALWADTL